MGTISYSLRAPFAPPEKVWVVHRTTWQMQLMWPVDAREAIAIGDYAYAPVGGYDPPQPRKDTSVPVGRTGVAGPPPPPPRKAA
jgi:hypothetical protein